MFSNEKKCGIIDGQGQTNVRLLYKQIAQGVYKIIKTKEKKL